MKNKFLHSILLFCLVLSTCSCSNKAAATVDSEGTSSITTDNYANKNLKFYYYLPPNTIKSYKRLPVIVLIPGTNQAGETMVTPEMKNFAKTEGFAIIAPTFILDEKNFESQTCYYYPAALSGKALTNMIDSLQNKGIFTGKLYMMGFSAGAQVVGRFSLLYPNDVAVAVVHASGGEILLSESSPVKYLISVGTNDENRRKQNALNFFNSCKRYGVYAEYKEYTEGHALCKDDFNDAMAIFKKFKE